MTTDKILIQDNGKVIELTGAKLNSFLADRDARIKAEKLLETEAKTKAAARESALAKLADLGLTAEEIAAL
jgi:hypothetical protein|uniref:hypothetical protein n=1 Tax=Limnohabitans sp. TaxID=1907725 RepID=UPI0040484E49